MRSLAVDRVDRQKELAFGSCLHLWARHNEWRKAWLGELKKTREIDSDSRDQIKNDQVYTC